MCLFTGQALHVVYDVIRVVHKVGVEFKVCVLLLEAWCRDLITEIDETIGVACLIEEAMRDDSVAFTY